MQVGAHSDKSRGHMIIGEYNHNFDDKNRVSLPAKFRKEMGKEVVIAPGIDNCLFIFTKKTWKDFADRLSRVDNSSVLKADNRTIGRLVIGRAAEVEVDSMGRMLIPEHLRAYAGLSSKVVLVGIINRVEVWSDEAWSKYRDEYNNKTKDIADKMASAGMI